jgi:hypothetical protein
MILSNRLKRGSGGGGNAPTVSFIGAHTLPPTSNPPTDTSGSIVIDGNGVPVQLTIPRPGIVVGVQAFNYLQNPGGSVGGVNNTYLELVNINSGVGVALSYTEQLTAGAKTISGMSYGTGKLAQGGMIWLLVEGYTEATPYVTASGSDQAGGPISVDINLTDPSALVGGRQNPDGTTPDWEVGVDWDVVAGAPWSSTYAEGNSQGAGKSYATANGITNRTSTSTVASPHAIGLAAWR